MAKNWAIVIGINQYDFLQPLNYAKRDAQLMREFLSNEIGFENVFFFCDDSPDVGGKQTRPYRTNLLRVLRQLFEIPFMEAGDNFWFFFSGHGIRHNGYDYLMPSDGDPGDIERTAISINYVNERLRRCGADNVVLILDACRNQGTRGEGIGQQTEEMARTTGVISIFSCSPNEYSYEIDALQQGAFTRALLDGLGIQGQCATVERLNQYLSHTVPEIVRQHKNARQTPYMIVEPINKFHLILVPKYATLADIATLKNDAYQAEINKQFELAKKLWIRVNAASSGQDIQVIEAFERIAQSRHSQNKLPPSNSANLSPTVESGGKSKSPTSPSTSQPKIIQSSHDDLSSDRNVDYTRLRDLLATENWKDADYETYLVMLQVVGRKEGDWIRDEKLLNFPCTDLRTIDSLWVKYSNGRFGFSVQKNIYLEVGGIPDGEYHSEAWKKFGDRVGWRVNLNWIYYDDVTFDTKAPVGHLPVRGMAKVGPLSVDPSLVSSLASRLIKCNL